MSDIFKASNSWHIDEDGALCDSIGDRMLSPIAARCARWFYLEERDHELGRWRDPENPDYVVYPQVDVDGENVARVVNEKDGSITTYYGDIWPADPTLDELVAHRYFAAHPQHKPLPTEPGMYVHAKDAREFPQSTAVLVCARDGSWYEYGEAQRTAKALAQAWHDAGELVRLVPEGGGDGA